MRRLLLDTHVLVSAAIRLEGKPARIIDSAAARYELLTTEHIWLNYPTSWLGPPPEGVPGPLVAREA